MDDWFMLVPYFSLSQFENLVNPCLPFCSYAGLCCAGSDWAEERNEKKKGIIIKRIKRGEGRS